MDFEASTTDVNFLDLNIFWKNGTIQTSIYQKPTNKFLYVPFHSHHPKHTLKGFIWGELQRYSRYCSQELDYSFTKNQFYHRLLNRGYPRWFIDPIFLRHKFKHEVDNIRITSQANEAYLVLRHSNRDIKPLQQLIYQYRNHFKDSTLRISWKKSPSLGDYLLHSHLTEEQCDSLLNRTTV